jgi:acyl CoA:acetate/3-ketoacid CoA transferase alpha subunit
MINKVETVQEALQGIEDGMTIMLGFGLCGFRKCHCRISD